jgi:hypothetical protein
MNAGLLQYPYHCMQKYNPDYNVMDYRAINQYKYSTLSYGLVQYLYNQTSYDESRAFY